MILHTVLQLAVVLFPVSEIALSLLKRGPRTANVDDRGSMRVLWFVTATAVLLAIVVGGYRAAGLPFSVRIRELIAVSLLIGGLLLRWAAILMLGRFFTVNVAVHEGQRVVTTGPYRFVRHPSYTGLLLAFLGLGVFFDNWLSLAVIVVPITLAVIHRIRIEESVLVHALGPAYSAYCARTKRLMPWVF